MSDGLGRFEIPESLAGERLDRALAILASCSRSQAAGRISDGRVELNGAIAQTGSVRLEAGWLVVLAADPTPAEQTEVSGADAAGSVPFEVLHADEHLVVVSKPAGVVTHRGAGHHEATLADALAHRFPEIAAVGEADRPGIVHRLDRGTSGALVCARSQAAYDGLVAQLAQRQVRRVYAALVRGHAPSPSGTVDAPLGRDPLRRTRRAVVADGRPARTHYEVVEAYGHPVEASLLRCTLETGRTHQIRVHMASIAMPILGDLAYGVRDPFGIERPLLHAAELSFSHPVGGREMAFKATIPADFAEALRQFGSAPEVFDKGDTG